MPPSMADAATFAPPLRLRMRRRLEELLALVLAACGVALLVALASYNPADPSLDTATTAHATNLAGPPGAIVADALLQGFGLAAFLPGLALLGWAWRIGSHRGLTMALLRVAALLAALPGIATVMAIAAAQSGASMPFPTESGPGGAVGQVLAGRGLDAARTLFGPLGASLSVAGVAILALILAVLALGLTAGEWRAAGRAARGSALQARRASGAVAQGTSTLVRFGTWLLHTVNGTKPAEAPRVVGQGGGQGGGQAELPPAPRQQWGQQPAQPRAAAVPPSSQQAMPAAFDRSAARGRTEPSLSPPAAAPTVKPSRFAGARPQQEAPPPPSTEASWILPPLSLLAEAPPRGNQDRLSPEQMEDNARLLESVLKDYGVQGEIVAIRPGPVVTLYELEPAPGTRAARVIGLADDVARSLSVHAVRVAVVPGRSVLGIEVPNAKRETVYLIELLTSEEWERQNAKLGIALGQDISGAPVLADLARMPHLLVAGTTGSGKSVGINAMILSLLYKLSPAECRLIMIDPKMLELSVYADIPHLLAPVVTDPAKAVSALKWTVREMERRYRAMSQLGVRNLAGYNARVAEALSRGEIVTRRVQIGFDSETNKPQFEDQQLALQPMPLIVVVIDEMADLMMVAGKDIETSVMRLAQMARAAGIHVIMATQRPSVDVITGTIKANFPTRISFRVVNKHDSRTILGEMGAEQLLGQGDMLFQADSRTTRVHGPFVSDREVEDVVAFLREQGEPDYQEDITEAPEEPEQLSLSGIARAGDDDKNLFDMAVDVVTRDGKASTSYLQRCLKIGYNRAANLIEQMEREGIITAPNHVGKRDILARRRGEDD
jgi:S-DNA-T family DNA segregation ATPase FtsK/SpoIIIE